MKKNTDPDYRVGQRVSVSICMDLVRAFRKSGFESSLVAKSSYSYVYIHGIGDKLFEIDGRIPSVRIFFSPIPRWIDLVVADDTVKWDGMTITSLASPHYQSEVIEWAREITPSTQKDLLADALDSTRRLS